MRNHNAPGIETSCKRHANQARDQYQDYAQPPSLGKLMIRGDNILVPHIKAFLFLLFVFLFFFFLQRWNIFIILATTSMKISQVTKSYLVTEDFSTYVMDRDRLVTCAMRKLKKRAEKNKNYHAMMDCRQIHNT